MSALLITVLPNRWRYGSIVQSGHHVEAALQERLLVPLISTEPGDLHVLWDVRVALQNPL